MAKITNIEAFYFGDKSVSWAENQKIPIKSATYEVNFSEIDVTDSATAGDSSETIVSRADRSSKIEGVMYVSGSKVVGKGCQLTFNSVVYPCTSVSYDETYSEIDVTDSATTGNGKETVISRAKRSSKVSAWVGATADDMTLGTAQTATLLFATGCSVTGSAVPMSKSIQGSVNEATKIDYSLNWNSMTETLPGLPTVGVEKDCMIVFKSGSTTKKAVEGKAIITADSVSADVNSDVKFTLTLKWNGTPTETKAD